MRLACEPAQASRLSVCDTGSPVARGRGARIFFREPDRTRRGACGIGLYHAARQAKLAGYRLELTHSLAELRVLHDGPR